LEKIGRTDSVKN